MEIDLGKAWALDTPGVGFDQDVVLEQRARFSVPVEELLRWRFLVANRRRW